MTFWFRQLKGLSTIVSVSNCSHFVQSDAFVGPYISFMHVLGLSHCSCLCKKANTFQALFSTNTKIYTHFCVPDEWRKKKSKATVNQRLKRKKKKKRQSDKYPFHWDFYSTAPSARLSNQTSKSNLNCNWENQKLNQKIESTRSRK